MISLNNAKKYCCEDISLIENYDKAISDDYLIWHCHHRNENIASAKCLQQLNLYFNRPASELIFLTPKEHKQAHLKIDKHIKKLSDETRLKISKGNTGLNNWTKGCFWFNNGIRNVRAKECPDGFVKGKIKVNCG